MITNRLTVKDFGKFYIPNTTESVFYNIDTTKSYQSLAGLTDQNSDGDYDYYTSSYPSIYNYTVVLALSEEIQVIDIEYIGLMDAVAAIGG